MNGLEKIRIEILGAVRQASDGGHHQHQVDEILLVLPKDPGHFTKAGQAMLLPGRRLGREQSKHRDHGGENQAAKKHPPPAEARFDGAQSDRGQQVAHRIARLHDPGEEPAPAFRRTLHHQRGADAPVSAHADAIKTAQDNEHSVAGRKGSERCDDGEVQHTGDQRTAAAIAIGQGTKHQRAYRPHGQGDGDGPDDVALAYMEVVGENIDQEDEHEKVERVEDPAQYSGRDGEAPSWRYGFCRGLDADRI